MSLNLSYALTLQQLSQYDGSDSLLPICVAIKGVIFDMPCNPSAHVNNPNYNCFTDRDASKARTAHYKLLAIHI
ncbi:hypothetical protein PS15p_200748 [Mucor circinelloides]